MAVTQTGLPSDCVAEQARDAGPVQEQRSVTAPVGHGQHDWAPMAHRGDVDEGRGVQDGVHGCCVVAGPVRLTAHPRQGGGFIGVRRGAVVVSSGHNARLGRIWSAYMLQFHGL